MRSIVCTAVLGVAFGFALSRIGFSSWEAVHEMFVFGDLRLFLTFIAAVIVLGLGWLAVRSATDVRLTPRRIHRGTLAGGVLFGVGWALSGACPGIVWVQIGEGQLGALLTFAGMLAGNWLYSIVHPRFFRWSTGSCLDD